MKSNSLESGIIDIVKVLSDWKNQPNPPKVYILGNRIHHGPIFVLLTLAGLYYKKPYLVGAGITGALDDIDDLEHWFDFEDGGNSNSLIDFA